jgi:uncharacterized protein (DUF983 family)
MRSSLSGLWQGRCPRCREGKIFKHEMVQIRHFADMNTSCPHCGASFQPEPGFYFGALYVSYAFTVILFVLVWLILHLFIHPPDWVYLVCIAGSAVVTSPFSFRFSRIIWLYWFGGLVRQS